MSLWIVTDSTCDLSPQIIDTYGISIIPLTVNTGERVYRDGVDLPRREFYQQLPTLIPHPTTAAPGPDLFQQVYEGLAHRGATEILSIHLPATLSATINYARQAAQQTETIPITVFDARQLSMGLGFVVRSAAQLAQAGQSSTEVLPQLEALIKRIHLFAVLDTLDYVKRSGRINWALANIGTLLRIKPLFNLYDGQTTFERIRTYQRAIARLVERVQALGPLEEVVFLHTGAATKVDLLRDQLANLLPTQVDEAIEITPVIGSHLGPDGVGVACLKAAQ